MLFMLDDLETDYLKFSLADIKQIDYFGLALKALAYKNLWLIYAYCDLMHIIA